ncbi:hypothetical protein M5K25_022905 [Dendrobium thyrsiflorum]|uniref:Uncharacterized protein n=1 Tax=Dendrobium thyrsiflorum TaxID=117978 RepID=A0ABD0UDH9_DENTH
METREILLRRLHGGNLAVVPNNGNGAPHLMNSITPRNPSKLLRSRRLLAYNGSKCDLIG